MPDPATDTLRTALEELTEAVTDKIGTMNYYFGPGARTAVSGESEDGYRRIVAARDAAREALAAAPAEPKWEWRAYVDCGTYGWPSGPTGTAAAARLLGELIRDPVAIHVERRRKAGEWERVT